MPVPVPLPLPDDEISVVIGRRARERIEDLVGTARPTGTGTRMGMGTG